MGVGPAPTAQTHPPGDSSLPGPALALEPAPEGPHRHWSRWRGVGSPEGGFRGKGRPRVEIQDLNNILSPQSPKPIPTRGPM